MNTEPPKLRLAVLDDVPPLEQLIPLSVYRLQSPYYSKAQMDAALGPVFGVDRQLISDGTYFVAEQNSAIIGCGGWSKRKSKYGGDAVRSEPDPLLDPTTDAARIRAFFIHPDFARKGIGSSILRACEEAIRESGFAKAELVATLAGEPLYASFGYEIVERLSIPLANGLELPGVWMMKVMAPLEKKASF